MINDPAIQHPPYLTFGALRVHVQRHLPAATAAAPPRPTRRPGATAPGDVGVAGEGRRHRVVQGPGRALLGTRLRSGRCPAGSPAASTSRRLAPWPAGSGLRRAFRQGRDDVLQQRRRHIGAEKPGLGVPSGRPTHTPIVHLSVTPTDQASRKPKLVPVFQASRRPDCPIHRTGGRGGRRFPGCPGQSRRLRRSSYGTPRGCSGRNRGRPDRPPRASAGRRPPALPMWCRLRPKSSSGWGRRRPAGAGAPARQHNRGELTGPTRSSRSTAGTFRDRCSAWPR